MTSERIICIFVLALTALLLFGCSAFTIPSFCLHQQSPRSTLSRESSLNLGGLFGGNEKQQEASKQGTKVFDVQAKEIKVGGLRFFLNIYLVGQSNTPEQGTWLVQQDDDGKLDLYYKDGTGMLSIDMKEYEVTATRFGEKPSLKYMLNESVMLHGLLDELNTLAFEVDDIEEEKRLIRLNDPGDAIELAREKLPAKPET